MANGRDFNGGMSNFLNSEAGKKLSSKKSQLEKIANSADGQRVQQILGGQMEAAVKSGDVSAMASAMQALLNTKKGSKLADQLRELMK